MVAADKAADHYDADAAATCIGPGTRVSQLAHEPAHTGVRADTAECGVWTFVEGELEICERADINTRRWRRFICLGVHSCRRGQMVRHRVILRRSPTFSSCPSTLLFSSKKMLMYIGYGLSWPFYLQWSVFEREW
jgi:hypothetical protein